MRDDGEADERQQSAEDAIADVIGQRKGGVSNPRRKRFDEISGSAAYSSVTPSRLSIFWFIAAESDIGSANCA